ncbi:uncharacterized protein LOC115748706 isoform X2 [Rhodamnia argentea]|uniref:Uncharacterized protein LOC115748706 isoform X2 n=1 Tax=Rhodamnia argentea TaxID=178133 RepID=A0A8B8Q462_9MYRT|nr:uncharacterized protein LOC115748706 isoform X2 [Rhodamnia argentea]
MGHAPAPCDYEDLRNARILENQARLASLGLQKTIRELRSLASSAKPVREYRKKVYSIGSLRRSERLSGKPALRSASVQVRRSDRLIGRFTADTKSEKAKSVEISHLRRSNRLKPIAAELVSKQPTASDSPNGSSGLSLEGSGHEEGGEFWSTGGKSIRPANKPLLKLQGLKYHLSADASSRRCDSKGRGSIYDPLFGISCHFCRQKKLCGEEDCKRCGDLDMDEPCIGKTDCSVCHSAIGVLCRGCLKVRYGEEMEEVRENKDWMCPHCVEATGSNPYWICNSSICLKKQNRAPTGIAVYRARAMGYKSVAHLLMDELQRAAKRKR